MNFGTNSNTVDFGDGLRDISRETCNGCTRVSSLFDDAHGTRPMTVICWVTLAMCLAIIIIALPLSLVNGGVEHDKTSYIIFYSIIGFFFVVSLIVNIIVCRNMYRQRQQAQPQLDPSDIIINYQ